MIEHVFPPEMMLEREKQLTLALLDCAGVCYDVNFTRDQILGNPIQIIDGKPYSVLEQIGMKPGCSYSSIIDYWVKVMPPEEAAPFAAFSSIGRIKACYAAGQRLLSHRFWTFDVLGNRMLAEQRIRLYEDCRSGDLLGLVYVSNGDKYADLLRKEAELKEQYVALAHQADFLQVLSANVPGGYHRVGTGEGFPLEFVSNSFLDIVGWSREALFTELDNRFINLVAPEDRERFMSMEPALVQDGKVDAVYRIHRPDGSRRWVQDSTQYIKTEGHDYYQCTLADITDFVLQQERLAQKNLELQQQKNMMEIMEANMPSGYHRCKAESGLPFLYIARQFEQILGYSAREIREEFGNLYCNLVWPEDVHIMDEFEKMMTCRQQGNVYTTVVYRMRHRDGGYRWVTDSIMFMDLGEDSFFQCAISDITEYMDSLNEARVRAEESSRAKSSFLFNASHDIRTPMNAIKGFARIIDENREDPRLVGDAVRKILKASDTLMTLMNDILELARIEQGKEEISAREVDLCETGRNLYEMFAEEMQSTGITFRQEGEALREHILCDELKLTRILMNMLSNARKFTPSGGMVTFGCTRLHSDGRSATYRFYVKDTGVGMSEEFQKRAFEQFERERTSTESGVSGSGLGLAIIKRLVELMGGTVSLKSRRWEGTEISATLTFPLVRREEGEKVKQDASLPDMSGRRVLLVEDNDFNREIARYVLEGMQFTVEEAENGAICVHRIQNAPAGWYDLVLMDIQMPIMDGYTAAREIRNMPDRAAAAVPIIAMTANAFEEDRQRSLEAGMNGHVGKPIDLALLTAEISGVLAPKNC